MKRANSNKRKSLFYLVLFAVCLCFFNVSCGLDVLKEVLPDPYYSENTPIADRDSESDFATSYFEFTIRKVDNANDFGRASIYYKIYNDYSKASSEESSIISKSSDTVYNTSFTTMRQYGYKELQYMNEDDETVHSLDLPNGRHKLWIRLTNYDDSTEDYSAGIKVDEESIGIPVRHNGKTFDFGRSGTYDENPSLAHSDTDSDSDTKGFVEKQADGQENIFYVVLFGGFQDFDDSYDENNSPVHHLGRVKIDANKEKN